VTTPGLCSTDYGKLSPRYVAPVRAVWWLCSRRGLVGTDAFPNINASSFRVPDAALREQIPVDVELPDTRCIADDGRHVRTIVRGSQFERGDGDGEDGG